MPDFATSTHAGVQQQLERLAALSPGADVLGLERVSALLDRLGNPHRALPPVFHVAGTNGKGSTCAFLRAALEAEGHRVHVYTSPHLVRFNERIRVAGTLIGDDALAILLARVLESAEDIGASFFEVTTAAMFLAFAEEPADACVIEVGLGGRLDATNVIEDPAACGIAQLGIDHQAFLGNTAEAIAREKAGIAKPGRPLVTLDYGDAINAEVRTVAEAAGARLRVEGLDWQFGASAKLRRAFHSMPANAGTLMTPWPALAGDHQVANLALAVAMLSAQERVTISPEALKAAATNAQWSARMQRLRYGPLVALAPGDVWLDGGHNPAAAHAVAAALAKRLGGQRPHLIVGMLANKDAIGFLQPFAPLARSVTAVPIPGHDHHSPDALASLMRSSGTAATTAQDVSSALIALPRDGAPTAILGSLYLAGEVLRLNDELPT